MNAPGSMWLGVLGTGTPVEYVFNITEASNYTAFFINLDISLSHSYFILEPSSSTFVLRRTSW